MQIEPGASHVQFDAHRCRCGTRRHAGGHEAARPGGWRGLRADAVEPRLPAPRMCAPASQRSRWHPVGLGPYLRLLARGTIRRHLLQAPFHLLSIHVHLVSFVDCRWNRSEEHTSELQSHLNLVCRLLLEKKKRRIAPLSLTISCTHI